MQHESPAWTHDGIWLQGGSGCGSQYTLHEVFHSISSRECQGQSALTKDRGNSEIAPFPRVRLVCSGPR